MYEHRTDKLLSSREFAKRVLRHMAIGFLAIGAALAIGIRGITTSRVWIGLTRFLMRP